MIKFYFLFLLAIIFLSACAKSDTPSGVVDITPTPVATENHEIATVNYDIETDYGTGYIKQTALIDLDGDGTDEQITVYYSFEGINSINGELPYDIYFTCEITVEKTDQEYMFTWQYENIRPQLNFANFNKQDGKIQFYFEGDGPSGDPFTQIFSFDGTRIIENTGFPGFITDFDGLGRIYSFEIYSVNSYYDLHNGLTPLPKENIVGTEIRRDFNVLLCTTIGNGYTAAMLSSYYEEDIDSYTQYFKDEFICLVPTDTPLIVLDIEFVTNPWDDNSNELYPVPWIKVRTPDGTEGWFCVVYGD